MNDKIITRRRALKAAALFGVALSGCGDRNREQTVKPEKPAEEPTILAVPPPVLGWEVIASGSAGPGPRSRHGLVYDRHEGAAVLFGGVVYRNRRWDLKSDTWELHGRKWTRIGNTEAPPARHRGAMAYMDQGRQTLLFGGEDARNTLLGDTWVYSARRWRLVSPGPEAPSPRCGHSLAFDERSGTAVLFGGVGSGSKSLDDTWLFDGARWKKVEGKTPPSRRYAALAYAPDLNGCLLHGGSDDESGERSFGDAWLFRDQGWEPLGKDWETDPRDDHGLGYHAGAKRLVMLEGVAGARGLLAGEPSGWRPVEAVPIHPRHQCSPLAWEAALGGLLMHGGEAQHGGPQFDKTLLLRMPSA